MAVVLLSDTRIITDISTSVIQILTATISIYKQIYKNDRLIQGETEKEEKNEE